VKLLAAFELERREHVIAGSTVQHLVVEEESGARDEAAARADAPALEGGGVQPQRRHRKRRTLGPFVEAAAELEFFLGAPRLPVAERIASAMKAAAAMPGATPGRNARPPMRIPVMISQGVHSAQKVPAAP